jgi:hypothetical protein
MIACIQPHFFFALDQQIDFALDNIRNLLVWM